MWKTFHLYRVKGSEIFHIIKHIDLLSLGVHHKDTLMFDLYAVEFEFKKKAKLQVSVG